MRLTTEVNLTVDKTATKELHVFSDASEKAIAAVAYLRTTDSSGEPNIGFILGKAKVVPTSGHTIPRLKLSAAVLAVEMTQTIMDNLDLHIDTVKFYTDSKVVLGYISNETRRFFIYVANRVEKISQVQVNGIMYQLTIIPQIREQGPYQPTKFTAVNGHWDQNNYFPQNRRILRTYTS
ncbi:Hypothetical predicted protein [Mytilus galloprovincialis]|uniref:RNase H type-1 domain-containing protein n=1 Tax=Mytilus galloprovincialis TaxID=29158 RepID=A0A8B6HFH6_MYTGA|nr:Hypothetical predicted protein [Mytilus galloprovincialis]